MSEPDQSEKPEWWLENEKVREELGLPAYAPPRFQDDVYVHEVVDDLSASYGCSIDLIGVGTKYLDDWEVRVDGESVAEIGRQRDEQGNTIYTLTSDSFRERITDHLEEQ